MAQRNPLFIPDNFLASAIGRGHNCNLVTLSNAFAYDVDQKPASYDLVIDCNDRFSFHGRDLYSVPFISSSERVNIFREATRRLAIDGNVSRVFGYVSNEDSKPVLYDLIDGCKFIPAEYFITDLKRLKSRVTAQEMARITSSIESLW